MTTLPLNLLYGLWCGGCLAACVRPVDIPGDIPPWPARPLSSSPSSGVLAAWLALLKLPALFALLSVMPPAIYLAARFPDWTLMYAVDPARLPRLWALWAGMGTAAAVVAGFVIGACAHKRHGAWRLGLGLSLFMVIYAALVIAALGWRSALGSDLPSDLTSDISWSPDRRPAGLGYTLIGTNLVLAASLAIAAHALITKSEFVLAKKPGPSPGPGPSDPHSPYNHWQS